MADIPDRIWAFHEGPMVGLFVSGGVTGNGVEYRRADTPIAEIAAERRRQIEHEGLTREHDDAHEPGQLAEAASYYAWHALDEIALLGAPIGWPFEPGSWKPTTARRDLIKAAALIVAEIERLDREEARDG